MTETEKTDGHDKRTFVSCRLCGKKFHVHPSQPKRGQGKYCSLVCYRMEHIRKTGTKKCKHCRKMFNREPGQSDKQWKKRCYCSLSCMGCGNGQTMAQRLKIFNIGRKRPDVSGANSHFWKGGISKYQYPPYWTKTLKKEIRERDDYTCQMCKNKPSIVVHHIDYNKNNCSPENLVTLCPNCHVKTNWNRDVWMDYFNNDRN